MDSRRAGGGNRMMTSTTLSTNDMWSKTIGYDPHAAAAPEEAPEDAEDRERRAERDKGVMELARLATINQGGGNRGAPRRPRARNPRSRVAKPGGKKTPCPPRAGDKFAQNLFWGLKRKAPPKGYEMVALESSSSSDDSSDDDEAAAKRRRAGADDERKRRKRERKDAKREKKRAKKEAKRAKKASKKEKKKRSRDD